MEPRGKIKVHQLSERLPTDPMVVLTMRCEDTHPTDRGSDIVEPCVLCGHDCWVGKPMQELEPKRILCLNCFMDIKGSTKDDMETPDAVKEAVAQAMVQQEHNLAEVLIHIAYLYKLWDATDHENARRHND